MRAAPAPIEAGVAARPIPGDRKAALTQPRERAGAGGERDDSSLAALCTVPRDTSRRRRRRLVVLAPLSLLVVVSGLATAAQASVHAHEIASPLRRAVPSGPLAAERARVEGPARPGASPQASGTASGDPWWDQLTQESAPDEASVGDAPSGSHSTMSPHANDATNDARNHARNHATRDSDTASPSAAAIPLSSLPPALTKEERRRGYRRTPPPGSRGADPDPRVRELERELPRDPSDAPFAAPPGGQLPNFSAGRASRLTRRFEPTRRIAFSILPTFAVVRGPTYGRSGDRLLGAGFQTELDLRIARPLMLRVSGSLTAHPVEARFNSDGSSKIANGGNYVGGAVTVPLVYLIDIGRITPTLEVGPGVTWFSGPEGILNGTRGQTCRVGEGGGGECEIGLRCDATDFVCRPGPTPTLAAGVGIDVLLGAHFAAGASARYWVLFNDIENFPFYFFVALRGTVRF